MEVMEGIDREELERRVQENDKYLTDLKSKGGTTDLAGGELLAFVATVVAVCLLSLLWR